MSKLYEVVFVITLEDDEEPTEANFKTSLSEERFANALVSHDEVIDEGEGL